MFSMKSDDLQKAPKLFAENIKIGYTPEYFVMGVSSGKQAQIYSLTPGHAKRLQQYLAHELANYEAKHGGIDTTWDPSVKSPMQKKKNPPTDGS